MNPEQYALIRKTMGTQKQVAEMLGVARETIARREAGKDRITKEAGLALIALSASPQNQKPPTTPSGEQVGSTRLLAVVDQIDRMFPNFGTPSATAKFTIYDGVYHAAIELPIFDMPLVTDAGDRFEVIVNLRKLDRDESISFG